MTIKNQDPAWRVILNRSAFFNDAGYGSFVADWPFEYYRQRAVNAGFVGMGRVLDVGCGHGHWTCALASLNDDVVGVDIHQHRVQIGAELIEDLWIDNAKTRLGNAMELPFGDEEFDGVFCYGVFMFLDPIKALVEFRRVLKPGGKLYLCTNGPGWWLRLAMKSALSNRSMARAGWRAFLRSSEPGTPSSFSIVQLSELLEANGFIQPRAASEGLLLVEDGARALKPVYAPNFFGFDNVIEAVATKDGVSERQELPELLQRFPILREARNVLQATYWSDLQNLIRFRADDIGELANATHYPRLSYAQGVGAGVDRADFLAATAQLATAGHEDDTQRIRALVTFCQRFFYHHFAVQPIVDDVLVEDPVEVFAIRAARCGSSARFLVDLLEVSGYEAGLLGGACHTSAEVFLNGAWRLLDPSLYPPGIHLVDEANDLLETEKVIQNPALLDVPPSYINYNSKHIDAFCAAYPETAQLIESYLRNPILPSIGYFGREFAGARAGVLTRYRKAKLPGCRWSDWSRLEPVQDLYAQAIPTLQRPEQVRQVELRGTLLTWSPARMSEVNDRVVYDVYVSPVSRGWTYETIPRDCKFALLGFYIRTDATSVDIAEVLGEGVNYVTLVAKRADSLHAFHLPSDEFIVQV